MADRPPTTGPGDGDALPTPSAAPPVRWDAGQLAALSAVATAGSFEGAAALLHITPSGVSQRLRALEQAAGRVLLVLSRPVRPTPSGEVLLRLSRDASASGIERLRANLPITAREADVLFWLSRGKASRDIGDILGLSPRTVTKHLESIYAKLGVENRTAASMIASRYIDDQA